MQKSGANRKGTQMVLRNKKILKTAQPNTDIGTYAYLSISLKGHHANTLMLAIIKEESIITWGKK